MLTSKQRSYLRSLANKMRPIFQIGKQGIEENFIKQVEEALEARELIKISILENSEYTAKEASQELCEKLNADGVQIIGNRFVLYKQSANKPNIELP